MRTCHTFPGQAGLLTPAPKPMSSAIGQRIVSGDPIGHYEQMIGVFVLAEVMVGLPRQMRA
jgi:hypothetical protein